MISKQGQVGHRDMMGVAVPAHLFASATKIQTGRVWAPADYLGRITVIGGKVLEQTVALARLDNAEDLHAPILSAVYVDPPLAAEIYADEVVRLFEVARSIESAVLRNRTIERARHMRKLALQCERMA